MERKLLLQLRIKHKLTQQQLADGIGISTVYVRKLEKGVVNPGRETMVKYENFFSKDMRKLFPDLFFNNYDKKVIKKEMEAIS
ncbi:HTH-type transcriptional regulator, repressor for puuD [Virgibacillus subterraneus]|uniref:HTH-type transcriptional regulator, repressor for puuD n=1 Tax=Virgibacillus subterraneus TaxID=621109 RepID=A0A1H8Z0J3_9BACI|nr:helix-turn-helix transcriptional regulator [Virgibacillus subterraneus]SEP57787.1 HTH-type transcriptional regulator, repressor for puuD [Virgibacillus subterraneus]